MNYVRICAVNNVPEQDIPTVGATINAGMNDGYLIRLVARFEPESPNYLAHKAKQINAHADK